MPRVTKKPRPSRSAALRKNNLKKSKEVDPNEVFTNLLHLFEHLGVDVSQQLRLSKIIRSKTIGSHTLYPHASAIGELFTTWHQKPGYVNDQGNPAKIPLKGPSPSFRYLAQRLVPLVDESYLLSELERLGAVTIEDGNQAQLHMRSFPVYEDKRLASQHTLTILNAFLMTLRHNLNSTASNSDQLFHRIAWNNNFDAKAIPALKVRIKRHGQNFLESFDDWISRKALSTGRKSARPKNRAHVSIGLYVAIDESQSSKRRL